MARKLTGRDGETAPEPPAGLLLADLPRGDGKEHVRVSIVEHEGCALVSVRTWARAKSGEYRPTPRGVHLRASELHAVRDALDAAIPLAKGNAA